MVMVGTASAVTLSAPVPLEAGALVQVAVAVLVFDEVAVTTIVTVQLPPGASVIADRDRLVPVLVAVALEPKVQLIVRFGLPEVVSVPV